MLSMIQLMMAASDSSLLREAVEIGERHREDSNRASRQRRQSGMHVPTLKANSRRSKYWVDRAKCPSALPRDSLKPAHFVKFDLPMSLWLSARPWWLDRIHAGQSTDSRDSTRDSASSVPSTGAVNTVAVARDGGSRVAFRESVSAGMRFKCKETGADFRVPDGHPKRLVGTLGRVLTE